MNQHAFVNKPFFKWFHKCSVCNKRTFRIPMAKCSGCKTYYHRSCTQLVNSVCCKSNKVESAAEVQSAGPGKSGQSGQSGQSSKVSEASAENTPIQRKALAKRGFTITGRIGKGGFGSILKARSERHHSQMAIKVIEKYSDGKLNYSFLMSISSEKLCARNFDHPYINVYHEVIETSLRVYMIMDYYPAGTLRDFYDEVECTPEPVAYEWFAQLCSALEYVHASGHAHRDVKMENVLLDQHRRIRLTDFGLCTAVKSPPRRRRRRHPSDRDTVTSPRPAVNHTKVGTLWYMSPELLAKSHTYNGQLADVWAAGVLLFCLVVGRFPYHHRYDRTVDNYKLVRRCQRKGHEFFPNETQRLSSECLLIFRKMFVRESKRSEIRDLKKDDWMVKGAQNLNNMNF